MCACECLSYGIINSGVCIRYLALYVYLLVACPKRLEATPRAHLFRHIGSKPGCYVMHRMLALKSPVALGISLQHRHSCSVGIAEQSPHEHLFNTMWCW